MEFVWNPRSCGIVARFCDTIEMLAPLPFINHCVITYVDIPNRIFEPCLNSSNEVPRLGVSSLNEVPAAGV